MGFLAKLLLGNGTLPSHVRATLASEGIVLIEEGLVGSIRYRRFRAPGRRFNGKITGECFGVGISDERFVVYCRSGRTELIDSPFASPRLGALDVSVDGGGAFVLELDYGNNAEASANGVSGQITIRARTPQAAVIVEALQARMPGTGA